jgi:hypothetical protein
VLVVRRFIAAALTAVVMLGAPAAARAADALSPVDGATVPSRPTFVFDVLNGVAEIELSRSPETLTAGSNVGEFVEEAASDDFLLYSRNPRDGIAPWTGSRLSSGRYYWHVRLRDDGADDLYTDDVQYPWGPVRTLDVEDEPIVFEGWLVRVQRLRATRSCATRLRVFGTIKWSDNEESTTQQAQYTVAVKAGTRTVGAVRGAFGWIGTRFDGALCSKRRITARTLTITPSLRDAGENLTRGETRQVRNPSA